MHVSTLHNISEPGFNKGQGTLVKQISKFNVEMLYNIYIYIYIYSTHLFVHETTLPQPLCYSAPHHLIIHVNGANYNEIIC